MRTWHGDTEPKQGRGTGSWTQAKTHLRSSGGIQAIKQGVGMGEGTPELGEGTPEPDEGHSGEPWGQGPVQPEAGPHALSSGLGTAWDSHQRAVAAGLPHFGGQDGGPQFPQPPPPKSQPLGCRREPARARQDPSHRCRALIAPQPSPYRTWGDHPDPGGGGPVHHPVRYPPPPTQGPSPDPGHPTIALFSLRRSTGGLRLLQAPTRVNRTSHALQQGRTEARLPAALRGGQGGLWGPPCALTTKGVAASRGGPAGLPLGSRGHGSPPGVGACFGGAAPLPVLCQFLA